MAKFSINKGGTWYTPKKVFVNKGGTWYEAKKLWLNKGGTWYECVFLVPSGNSFFYFGTQTSRTFTWQPDGSHTGAQGAGNKWLSDIATGNGDAFWIRVRRNIGAATASGISFGASNGTYGAWKQMNTSFSITLNRVGSVSSSSGDYQVSTDGGASVAATASWSIELEF